MAMSSHSRAFLYVAAALLFGCAAQTRAQKPPSAGSTPQSVLPSDKGSLRILLGGAEVGSEQFESQASAAGCILRSQTVIRAPGQPETRSSGELRVSADGAPLAYKWSAQGDKQASGSVEFTGGSAKTSLDLGNGKDPYEQDFVFPSPRVAILDNNLYSQYALLAQLYDWRAKGQQTFPVLIPQDLTPGTINVESLGVKNIEGSALEALRINTADLEVLAYFDAQRRLARIEVPSANVVIVRR